MVYLEKRNANLALGEKQMASRSFRVFGTRTDLESVFYEFQKLNLVKYYKCGRNENKIDDITKTIYFGISLNGSHIGNQYLVIKDDKSICFDKYKHISQYPFQSCCICLYNNCPFLLLYLHIKMLYPQLYLQYGMTIKLAKKSSMI